MPLLRHAMRVLTLVFIAVYLLSNVETSAADEATTATQLTSVATDKALDTMFAAVRDGRGGVRSVFTKAWYKGWSQGPDDEEPQLVTDGKFVLYFDEGKYHFRFAPEKMLQRTVDMPEGVRPSTLPGEVDVYRNQAGEIVQLPVTLVDWKSDNVFIVHDGQSIQSTVFASRIRPKGFRSQSHEQLQDACRQAGIRIEDPPCLVAELYDLEATVEHLGRDAFQVEALPEDGYRATFHMKNAPNVKIELEAFAKDGFHISTYRVLNEGQELPASIKHATWKKVDGHWIITKLTRENRFRGRKHLAYSKAIIGYYSWELNKRIDPSTFTAKSMNPDWKPDPVGE